MPMPAFAVVVPSEYADLAKMFSALSWRQQKSSGIGNTDKGRPSGLARENLVFEPYSTPVRTMSGILRLAKHYAGMSHT